MLLAGREVHVTYDIPDVGHADAAVAGGTLRFDACDAEAFKAKQTFRLRTADGLEVEGLIARVYSRSASVVISAG